jgi:ketol-acid reductoisomerase
LAARIYTDKDADVRWLKRKACAVIGFGAQGRAHAFNLRDSGMNAYLFGRWEPVSGVARICCAKLKRIRLKKLAHHCAA